MLHLFIGHILLPHYSSHTSFSHFDALMIFNIKHCVHLDLPSMMLMHMYSFFSHDAKSFYLMECTSLRSSNTLVSSFFDAPTVMLHHSHTYKYDSFLHRTFHLTTRICPSIKSSLDRTYSFIPVILQSAII